MNIPQWTVEDTKILCIFVVILLVSFGWIPFVSRKDKKKIKTK